MLTVAKLRLSDLEAEERKKAEHQVDASDGKMTVGDAVATYRLRLTGDASVKPRTRDYHEQRIKALLESWPELKKTEIRNVTKSECLNWSAKFTEKRIGNRPPAKRSATAFNHTVGILKRILEIGVEAGVRYDNPAKFIKRLSERSNKPSLPEVDQFDLFVQELESGGGRDSKNCADLVRFLAYGGFRKTEAAKITWADCNFTRNKVTVRGDPETGTKSSEVREVLMIPDMQQLLERLRGERPDETPEKPVMRVRECQKAMNRAAKVTGMHRITHHDLRHLFATRCIESGVDIPTVSRWLAASCSPAIPSRAVKRSFSIWPVYFITCKREQAANQMKPSILACLLVVAVLLQNRGNGQEPGEKDYLGAVLPPELIPFAGIEVPSTNNIHILSNSAGRYLEFRLLPGQARKNNGIRAEVSVDYPFKIGDVVRYKWKMRLPEDFKADDPQNRWWVMGQWHDQPDRTKGETWQGFPANSPPVSFNYVCIDGKDFLSVLVGSPKMKRIGLVPITRGAWHSLDVVIKWSQGVDGKVAVFLDGLSAPAVVGTGPNMHNGYQHYLKLGMYRHPGIASENRLAIREVSITKLTEWPVSEQHPETAPSAIRVAR